MTSWPRTRRTTSTSPAATGQQTAAAAHPNASCRSSNGGYIQPPNGEQGRSAMPPQNTGKGSTGLMPNPYFQAQAGSSRPIRRRALCKPSNEQYREDNVI